MKRLRDIGTVLFFLGWVPALILRYVLPEPSGAFLVPMAIAVLGAFMVVLSGIALLLKGTVQIRPFDAIKRAPLLLALLVPLVLLLRFVLPSSFSAMESVAFAVFMAIFFSFYSTAYRKPE